MNRLHKAKWQRPTRPEGWRGISGAGTARRVESRATTSTPRRPGRGMTETSWPGCPAPRLFHEPTDPEVRMKRTRISIRDAAGTFAMGAFLVTLMLYGEACMRWLLEVSR